MKTKTPESEIAEARNAIDALYTPLDEALELLRERRADENLRAAVADFHRIHPPDFLPDVPCAFWFRHISTPNHEFELFASTTNATGMQPICFEYSNDIFVAYNRDKYRLCRPLFKAPNHNYSPRITNICEIGGQRLCDITLSNGVSLLEFHHAMLDEAFPGFEHNLRDFSLWFSSARRNGYAYLHYLALFVWNGILFENFIAADPGERRFARERVVPSYAKAIEIFGVKPLIVRLLPADTENDEHWRAHPGALHSVALDLLNGIKRNA